MKSLLLGALVCSVLTFSWPAETKEAFVEPTLTKHFTGLINAKYKIVMNLNPEGNKLDGQYRYASQQSWLGVSGTIDPGTGAFHLDETDYKKVTGTFDGVVKGNEITGTWSNAAKTKSFPFTLATTHHDIMVTFKAAFNSEDGYVTPKSVSVYSADKKKLLQELKMGPDLEDAGKNGEAPELYFEDMNFDGYPDLSMPAMSGMVNFYSYFWVYDPQTKTFAYNEQLRNMSNPVVDMQNKLIKTSSRGSAVDYSYIHYSYEGGMYKEVYNGKTDK